MSLNENKYDAIVVLGGSFIDENTLCEWVEKRLDAAILRDPYCKYFLLLGRNSPIKKVIVNEKGQLISECQIMANYMIERKIDPKKNSTRKLEFRYNRKCLCCINNALCTKKFA